MKFITATTLLLACLLFSPSSAEQEAQNEVGPSDGPLEPPFPQLFDQSRSSIRQVSIVSERFDDHYTFSEEYLDLDIGENAFVQTQNGQREVTLIKASEGLAYNYKPYTCTVTPIKLIVNELWHSIVKIKDEDSTEREMLVYGVAAIWLNFDKSDKTYSHVEQIYSSPKNLHMPAHRWSIQTGVTIVSILFTENSWDSSYDLEMIEFASTSTGKVTETINILSVRSSVQHEIHTDMFQIPTGFGCAGEKFKLNHDENIPGWLKDDSVFILPFKSPSRSLQIQATATNFQSSKSNATKTSTINLELSNYRSYPSTKRRQIIRVRDDDQDIKTVIYHELYVRYEIDMRTDRCKMSNLGSTKADDSDETVTLNFKNGLKLKLDQSVMDELFITQHEYLLVKKVRASRFVQTYYLEKTSKKLIDSKLVRIVRVYSEKIGEVDSIELERVMIWVLNLAKTQLLESYQFNIIESSYHPGAIDIMEAFDVSEQCYLGNEKMLSGRDYAWIKLYYPMLMEDINVMKDDDSIAGLKYLLYGLLAKVGFEVARVEVMFGETEMITRALVLNLPPEYIIFDEFKDSCIDTEVGDLTEVAADLEHCSQLCKLSNCYAMSFCVMRHECILSARTISNGLHISKNELMDKHEGCITYLMPDRTSKYIEYYRDKNMRRMISFLKEQDYSSLEVKDLPSEDDLMDDDDIGGDKQEQYEKYITDMQKTLEEKRGLVANFAFFYGLGSMVKNFPPNKFELEEDPLKDFDLSDEDAEQSDDLAITYHEGLSMYRFKFDIINTDTANDKSDKKKMHRFFNQLSYDQCALACREANCNSFSYCTNRQECILSAVYTFGTNKSAILEIDPDCFIAQRDFLGKFRKYPEVSQPKIFKRAVQTASPSDCAYQCMVESGFKCLGFDFCTPPNERGRTRISLRGRRGKQPQCYLLETRLVVDNRIDRSTVVVDNSLGAGNRLNITCDHYSRSYLADFVHVEHRRIDGKAASKMKSNLVLGRSADECADQCANQINDCTAFQFCFDPAASGAQQSCMMIEGKPETSNVTDYKAEVNKTAGGSVVKAGNLFVSSSICHIYSLRKSSREARSRELVFEVDEIDSDEGVASIPSATGSGFLLYLLLTSLAAIVGFGLCKIDASRDFMREKLERVQMLVSH